MRLRTHAWDKRIQTHEMSHVPIDPAYESGILALVIYLMCKCLIIIYAYLTFGSMNDVNHDFMDAAELFLRLIGIQFSVIFVHCNFSLVLLKNRIKGECGNS